MNRARVRKLGGSSRHLADARTGLFRATLLFGSIAASLALIMVPEIDRRTKLLVAERAVEIDTMATGSIAASTAMQRYRIHRSILDRSGQGPCIMFPDGRQKGAC